MLIELDEQGMTCILHMVGVNSIKTQGPAESVKLLGVQHAGISLQKDDYWIWPLPAKAAQCFVGFHGFWR